MNFDSVINYLKKYEGMKYTKYNFQSLIMGENEPFWVSNTELPDFYYIYEKGSTCIGLINIIRRHLKLPIPGLKEKYQYPGGTGSWFKYLNDKNRLLKINFLCSYPKGSLLIQDFNIMDQGHVAVIIENNNELLESTIIHNINDNYDEKYNKVIIEKLNDYPNYKRFTHICLPENWLLRN
jgi:hypothetical protein